MYMICRHIKTNGLRCGSPALKGTQFCYYHAKAHSVGAEPNLKYGPLQLPTPEDSAAIQLSVARINDAVINGRIDIKKAASLFNGIKIAAQFIDRKQYFNEEKTVPSAEQTVEGDELAPGIYICNGEDCNECPFATPGQCTRWSYESSGTQISSIGNDDDEEDDVDDSEDDADDGEDADEADEPDDSEDGDEDEVIEEDEDGEVEDDDAGKEGEDGKGGGKGKQAA